MLKIKHIQHGGVQNNKFDYELKKTTASATLTVFVISARYSFKTNKAIQNDVEQHQKLYQSRKTLLRIFWYSAQFRTKRTLFQFPNGDCFAKDWSTLRLHYFLQDYEAACTGLN